MKITEETFIILSAIKNLKEELQKNGFEFTDLHYWEGLKEGNITFKRTLKNNLIEEAV